MGQIDYLWIATLSRHYLQTAWSWNDFWPSFAPDLVFGEISVKGSANKIHSQQVLANYMPNRAKKLP